MSEKNQQWIYKSLYLSVLCVLSACAAQATTTFNLSTGTAAYNITTDTITQTPDSSYTGPAIAITSLPGGTFAHIANPLSNGTDTGVWVGPNAAQSTETSSVTGTVTYAVTFDLTGYNLATATLTMNLGADDFVTVALNATNIFTPSGTQILGGMYADGTGNLNVSTGFIAGVNTITYVVANSTGDGASSCCGPTGLIAAVDVFANQNTVPEPGTIGISGLGLAALALVNRRRLGVLLGR